MNGRDRTTNAASETPLDPREEQLRAMFAAADVPVHASAVLRSRITAATAAAQAPRTRRALVGRAPWRIGLGLAGATALALTTTAVMPTWVASRILAAAEAAAEAASTAHIIRWRVLSDGGRQKIDESWYRGHDYRTVHTGDGRVELQVGSRLWLYDPKLNKVTIWTVTPNAPNAPDQFTLKAMRRGMERSGYRLRPLADLVVDGRRQHQVVAESTRSRERCLITVDAQTDLPLRMENQLQRDGRWVTEHLLDLRFDESLPVGLFTTDFPRTARIFDRDRGKEEWRQRLAKGIARLRVGQRMIVIRDLQVNAAGDLFMLYTAGRTPADDVDPKNGLSPSGDWDIEVKDDRGAIYIGRTGIMTDRQVPDQYRTGWLFNGERWEGDWWVSLHSQDPWQPRRITITFRVPATPYGQKTGEEQPKKSVTAVVNVRGPECAVVPDYMAYLQAPVQEREVPIDRASARARHYRFEQRDLPRALSFLQEVVRLRAEAERESGEHTYDAQTWLDIGGVLRDMCRPAEARAAYEQALREDIGSGNWVRQEAGGELEKLRGAEAWSVGRPAPAFTATDLNGHKQSPEQYRGKVLLIHFWGAWADNNGQLHADLPIVNQLYRQYGGQGLAVLGIAIHFERDKVDRIIREEHLAWPQLYDGLDWRSPLYRSFGAPKVPSSILIDRQGVVRGVGLRGPALEKAVTELLALP